MDQAIGDDAVEGRGDLQVGLPASGRARRLGRRRRPGLAFTRARAPPPAFGPDQFVAGDGSGRFGGFLEAVVSALRGGELRFGLQPVGLGGLHVGFGFGDAGGHFRGAQFDQQMALLHHAAAVHQHVLDVAGHLGV